jgi:RHS repeat-associated protein
VELIRTIINYHYNGIGSVTNLTDNGGNLIQSYIYDAFGNILQVDSYLKGKQTVTNPYRFSTKEYNPSSGLIYFGARYYDPKIGRFITPDPLGKINDPNLYTYCSNNPINYIDPFGFLKEKPWWQDLIEGRYFGTGYGKEATEWYAQKYVETGKWHYFVGGGFAALWTPDSWYWTAGTLVGGYFISGTVVRTGPVLTGFTRHGINQIINRGIGPAVILEAVRNPTSIVQKIDTLGRVSYQYIGKAATVVLNKAGEVITAWPR